MSAFQDWFFKNPVAVTGELVRLLPDSLVFMSGFFALLTGSYPQAIFFVALLESIVGYHILRKGISFLDIPFLQAGEKAGSGECKTGFRTTTPNDISFFKASEERTAFPSAPMYIISVAAAYFFGSLNSQFKELETLGSSYSARFYISVITLCSLLFLMGSWRMYTKCDRPQVVILSILTGLIIGTLLLWQNQTLLGPDSTNLLGIPLLKNRTVKGEAIYVCSKTPA
jgi:hypothetical protein